MGSLLENLKNYFEETLGIKISILPWKQQKKLPIFLGDTYTFFEATILNNSCLLMIAKDESELTPNTIQKHWQLVGKKWNALCIYISDVISSYNRKRLIQHHIPFIIPNNQAYLPNLGLDLREHFKQKHIHKQLFSPATQVVIISVLMGGKIERLMPAELAAEFGYSPMTMTRVFNELEAAQIGQLTHSGKERWWFFEGAKKDLWEQTKNLLRSPVRRREPMKLFPKSKMPAMPLAGISALAETTMLTPPELPTYAMDVEEYRQENKPKGFRLSHRDEADFEVEIWNYYPKPFQGKVDPFSLYLSLRDNKDERVEAALEALMEKIKW